MLYCDVIAGSMSSRYFQKTGTVTTPGKVGPFTGGYNVNANTGNDSSARGITYFEGTNNRYHIYRNVPKNTTAELMLSNSPAVRSNVKLNGALLATSMTCLPTASPLGNNVEAMLLPSIIFCVPITSSVTSKNLPRSSWIPQELM